MMTDNSLSLYIHIPFCVRKCAYCDFLSFPTDDETKKRYVNALLREIKVKSAEYRDRHVVSVFIGGGTPSVLPADFIYRITEHVGSCFKVDEDAEISIEVNPGTVTNELLDIIYRKRIVNRVSIGLQSANKNELALLGRIHTFEDYLRTFEGLRSAGVRNINTDLMFGIPGQRLTSFQETLDKVTELRPEHISAYSLILEEGTPLFEMQKEGVLELPKEESEREMYHFLLKYMKQKGYQRYEISNFAKPAHECRHNIRYWRRGDYLGLGLGSASFVNEARWNNTKKLDRYLSDPCFDYPWNIGKLPPEAPIPESPDEKRRSDAVRLTRKDRMEEFMFLGLRMANGISEKEFEDTFGVSLLYEYPNVVDKFVREGLLIREKGRIYLSDRGVDISNYVMSAFIR